MKSAWTGFRSWKTTAVGAALAALMVIQQATGDGVQWADPALWVAVGIAILGFLSKDSDRGALPLVGLLACLVFSGCETMRVRGTIGYLDPQSGAKAGLEITDAGGGWWIRVPLPTDEQGSGGGVMLVEGNLPAAQVDRASGK
jgi:hypothetical protein